MGIKIVAVLSVPQTLFCPEEYHLKLHLFFSIFSLKIFHDAEFSVTVVLYPNFPIQMS